MKTCKLTVQDIDAVVKQLQPEDWPDIEPHLRFYAGSSWCRPVKVMHEDRIVGMGTSIFHANTAWLAHIIVHKEYRNEGIGGMIVKDIIAGIDAKLYPTILLIATDLGEPVYKKQGFVTETEYFFYKNGTGAECDTSNLNLFEEKDTAGLLALDRQLSGEDRSWRLRENLNGATVYKHKNRIEGFYMPSLGEGLIVAETAAAGVELMKLRHKSTNPSALPAENKAGINYLEAQGFQFLKQAKRMRLGKAIAWQPQALFNRVGGQIG